MGFLLVIDGYIEVIDGFHINTEISMVGKLQSKNGVFSFEMFFYFCLKCLYN